MNRLKRFLFMILAFITLIGTALNVFRLFGHFYLWSLVRSLGYGSLFVYSLLMLFRPRYDTGSFRRSFFGGFF